MGTAVPLGTPVRGVTPSPTPCWAEVERGGGVGQGCGPPISTQSPVLSFSLFSTAAAQPCRARASLSRCMAPPGGYPASPRLLQSTSSRGSPWWPPSSFPPPVLLGGMGALRGREPPAARPPQSCRAAPPGRSVLGWQQEDVGDGVGVVPGAQSLGLICREGRTSMERGARGSQPCSLKTPTGGGVTVRGLGGRTPRDVLTEESLKRTRRHSSGQTARSSSGVICSSWWPDSTPRHLTVLGTDRQTVRGWGGLAQPGG